MFMVQTDQDDAVLQAILDASVDAIVVTDVAGQVLRVNAAVSRLFGYEVADILGQNVRILMPQSARPAYDAFIAPYRETGENPVIGNSREVEGLHKDGTVFPLRLSMGEATVQSQRVLVSNLHDLTAHQATLKALARSQRLDAIGQMTGGIAHDFNNLLTVIIGNLELLEMQEKEARPLSLVQDALEAAEMGASLIARLKVFARRSKLAPELIDLRDACRSALAMISRTIGAQYEVKSEFADDVSMVRIDKAELHTALINLALNARDAMPDGGELLFAVDNIAIDDTYLAQEVDVELGNYVRIMVSDTGTGMSEEAQSHAFEPFFTTKPDGSGTGLGLAMVYGFVRQSGGHITLYSEPGLGTSFGLYFPAATADEGEGPLLDDIVLNTADVEFGQGQVVLVVEDNPNVRRLSVQRIAALGFQVEVAENADAAYAALQNGAQIDLVFSDVVMPGTLNGYDLAQKVATEFPQVKVLLTSGYASDALLRNYRHDPNRSILHKPYRLKDLVTRLQGALSG